MSVDGNIGIIPPEVKRVLQQCVNSIVNKKRFSTHEVKIAPLMQKGEGYLAIPYTIDIKGRTKNGEKEINIFVKIAIKNSSLDSFLSMHTAYLNECFMYKELATVFLNLQNAAGVPEEKRFKMIKGFEESTSEAIVLDNVSGQGFKSCNRMEIANVKFIELAFEQIAKFHALGFAMKKKTPEYFDKKIREMEHPLKFNDNWKAQCAPLLKISMKNLRPEIKAKAEKFQPIFYTKFEQHLKDQNSIGTICHGDFRANNLLFKEVEGVITEVMPIDYQLIHYGCPANDVLHLIYGCTDQEFRNAHKIRLIDLYYQNLGDFLKYFDIDVSEVYPREELDRSIEERVDYGLMLALYFYPIYFVSEDDIPDISNDLTQINFNLDINIVKRIEEIVEEYYKEKGCVKIDRFEKNT